MRIGDTTFSAIYVRRTDDLSSSVSAKMTVLPAFSGRGKRCFACGKSQSRCGGGVFGGVKQRSRCTGTCRLFQSLFTEFCEVENEVGDAIVAFLEHQQGDA